MIPSPSRKCVNRWHDNSKNMQGRTLTVATKHAALHPGHAESSKCEYTLLKSHAFSLAPRVFESYFLFLLYKHFFCYSLGRFNPKGYEASRFLETLFFIFLFLQDQIKPPRCF